MLRDDWHLALLPHSRNVFLGLVMTEEDARFDFFQGEKGFNMAPKITCSEYNS